MTANQITKKLQKAGLDISKMEIRRDEVTVCVGYEEVSNNGHTFGTCNTRQTKTLARKVRQTLGWPHGTTNGYGAWICSPEQYVTDLDNRL